VDSAHSVLRPGGQVIVMDGNHPDLSRIRGIDRFVDQVDPNSPDGVHWTEAGYTAQAVLLCELLFQKRHMPVKMAGRCLTTRLLRE
jgi:hypothetical protein